jgi:hypothetical protein
MSVSLTAHTTTGGRYLQLLSRMNIEVTHENAGCGEDKPLAAIGDS